MLVGDNVEIELKDGAYSICKIYDRTNELIRPKVANITQLVIVLASVPKPDFLLVDKLIIYAKIKKIKTCICVNKSDIASNDFYQTIKNEYDGEVDNIVLVSAHNNDISALKDLLHGEISVLCGQSAVGKSSLINMLIPNLQLEVGDISKKIERGKNTTRVTILYGLNNDSFIIDSPGFSLLEIQNVSCSELKNYYNMFNSACCYFQDCSHTTESVSNCSIKRGLENNKINKNRYSRYLQIYAELKNKNTY